MFDKYLESLEKISTKIFIVDDNFKIKYGNTPLTLLSGIHPDEIIDKICYEAIYGLKSPCKGCPIADKEGFKTTTTLEQDSISHTGSRNIFRAIIDRVGENLYAETLTNINDIKEELVELTHQYKKEKANSFIIGNDRAEALRQAIFLERSIDSLSEGLMIVSPQFDILNINLTLQSLSAIHVDDYKNLKCYQVYGNDEPCKDCPQVDPKVVKSLRKMKDKHMTVIYSKFDKFIVESLRDTTREIKLIDEIRSNQMEIKEKQRQMSLLNADLLRMNEKLKNVQMLIDEELKQVGHIQESLLPEELPKLKGYDFGAAYIPAEHAGGDYYDCIQMSNNHWGFVVADVSGHGTPAAVIMAITRAIMRSYTYDIVSSSEALTLVNDILCDNIHTKDFVTMFYMVLDSSKNKMNFASAGHNPVLLFDKSEFLVKKTTASGMFLGTFQNLEYEEKKLMLDDGDIFFMYTDGLVEAMSKTREQYGYDRLVSKLMMFSAYSCDKIIDEIMADVKDFVAGNPFEDDITILAIKKEDTKGDKI